MLVLRNRTKPAKPGMPRLTPSQGLGLRANACAGVDGHRGAGEMEEDTRAEPRWRAVAPKSADIDQGDGRRRHAHIACMRARGEREGEGEGEGEGENE
jgi:hypothetical protein